MVVTVAAIAQLGLASFAIVITGNIVTASSAAVSSFAGAAFPFLLALLAGRLRGSAS